ncbi:MAG TPA: hypothetical protein VJ836_01865 [Candidatus Saccharimonadales bacterium]|nr:hypothetical protein [Candidatus Saccharimonadales bacterium]
MQSIIGFKLPYYEDDVRDKALLVRLSTGKGVSVLEMIHAFEKAAGKVYHMRLSADAQVIYQAITQMPLKGSN